MLAVSLENNLNNSTPTLEIMNNTENILILVAILVTLTALVIASVAYYRRLKYKARARCLTLRSRILLSKGHKNTDSLKRFAVIYDTIRFYSIPPAMIGETDDGLNGLMHVALDSFSMAIDAKMVDYLRLQQNVTSLRTSVVESSDDEIRINRQRLDIVRKIINKMNEERSQFCLKFGIPHKVVLPLR